MRPLFCVQTYVYTYRRVGGNNSWHCRPVYFVSGCAKSSTNWLLDEVPLLKHLGSSSKGTWQLEKIFESIIVWLPVLGTFFISFNNLWVDVCLTWDQKKCEKMKKSKFSRTLVTYWIPYGDSFILDSTGGRGEDKYSVFNCALRQFGSRTTCCLTL